MNTQPLKDDAMRTSIGGGKPLRNSFGLPSCDPHGDDGLNVFLDRYAEAVRRVAARQNVVLVDIHSEYTNYENNTRESIATLLPDGMHPNDKGHEIVARLLFPAILPLL